jgi:hypothetical protein
MVGAQVKRTRIARRTPIRRSKFGNKVSFHAGRLFDSRKEADYARRLDMLKGAAKREDRVTEWEGQVRIPLVVNGHHVCDYYCDFRVDFADGRTEWHETKGFETPVWRIKFKLFKALYPDRVLRVIK